MKTQRLLRLLALWILMAIGGVRPAVAADPENGTLHMTVDQAIDEAVHNNLSLIAERLRIPVAQAETITARLRPNPSITYEVDNLSRPNPFSPHSLQERSVAVGIPLLGPGKRQLRIETAELGTRIAELEVADALRRLRADVETGYSDVLRASQRLRLATEDSRFLDDVVNLNLVRVDAGAVPRLELTRSQAALYLQRTEASRASVDLATAQLRFLTTIGRRGYRGAVELQDAASDAPDALPELPDLEAAALEHRPDLLAAQLREQKLESDLRLQYAEARIDPVAGVSYRRGGDIDPAPSWGLSITLPVPLFDRNQGEIARARTEKAQASAELAAKREEVLTDVRAAYAQSIAAARILSEVRTHLLPSAKQARDTAAYVYRARASSLLEFLDAERSYNETMNSLYDAQAAYENARFQLEAATGVLK